MGGKPKVSVEQHAIVHRLRDALGDKRGYGEIRMFGGLCVTLHGHMTAGVTKDGRLMIRVGKDNYEQLLAMDHAAPMMFTGRPMKSMLYIEDAGIRTDAQLERWLKRSVDFVEGLPPK